MTKLKKRIIIAVAIFVTIVVVLLSFYIINLSKNKAKPSIYSQFSHVNPLASYNIKVPEVIEEFNSFDLKNVENLVELKYISHEERTYLIGPEGDRIFFEGQMTDEMVAKLRDYMPVRDIVYTMKVKDVYKGNFTKGDKIEIVIRPMETIQPDCFINQNDVIVAVEDRVIEPNKYHVQMDYKGIYYVSDDEIIPAFDMTYEEMYKPFGADLSGYGNPVEKYKGMALDEFVAEVTSKKKDN